MSGTPLLDLWRLKIFSILHGPGADVLTFILKHGTKVTSFPVHLDKYLTSLPVSSTANYLKLKDKNIKKLFNPSELRQIQKYPLWDNFDVSLLFRAISLACEGIDDTKWKDQNEMEGLIKKIKDERNACVHEREPLTKPAFLTKVNELEGMFDKTLTEGQARYSVPVNDFTPVRDKVLQDISFIKKALTAKEIVERDIKDVLPLFMEESKMHLEGLYKQAQYFDPLSFLSCSPMRNTDIQSIFCNVFLIEKTDVTKAADIDCFDLLTLTKSLGQTPQLSTSPQATQSMQCKKPQFIMISGDAGSGKTTLLTFIMSEWLKDAHDCRIRYLNEYDIVLRILCREKDGPSLQDFLQQALPNIFVGIKDKLVVLLKECTVLFLIDGLDELSAGSSSDLLVTDILNKGKDVPGFTVICTSRPESVDDFLAKKPYSYQQWKMEMKGVSPAHRTDFVLRHYDSFPSRRSKDPDRLKYLMECIGWREHFGLPLNLLFVATLFYTEPDLLKKNITQTSLYLKFHKWCVQKLQHRLAGHRQAGRDRLARNKGIRKVLRIMYQIALKGLLQDRLSLSEEDTDLLRECCRAENLPNTEVMGAFLCLRKTVVMLVPDQKYFAPHKSMQEFFAAKHLVKNLQEGLTVGSIRRMLQDPSMPQLKKLKNLLLHVMGLLSQPDVPPLPGPIEEVVDLLAETGVKHCNSWLSLLENTEVNNNVLEHVAKHVTSNGLDDETVEIKDTTVTRATALLPLIPRKDVVIQLTREADTSELCQAAANHSCTHLYLQHHFKQPILQPASDSMLCALSKDKIDGHCRSQLESFTGHLSADGIMLLQESQHLEYLALAVSGDHDAQTILSTLAAARPSLPHLSRILLHVPVKTVTPEVFTTPLPNVVDGRPNVVLVLSGVEEQMLENSCRIAAALQPSVGEYMAITFPDSGMNVAVCRRLLILLADARVRVRFAVEVPYTVIWTEQERNELNTLALTRMLGGVARLEDDFLWLP